mgnify:CR=1 FL=1
MLTDIDFVAIATELAYQNLAEGEVTAQLPGFVVDRVFSCAVNQTGFEAVAFVNHPAQKLIMALRGSDSAIDFVANANLGIAQYLANRDVILSYVGSYIATYAVVVAGHSLGGGLAQYLAYDMAQRFPDRRDRIILQTQNGFGGILGITRIHGAYDPEVFAGVTVRNYRHPDDPVSRIGGQAGGNVLNIVDSNPLVHDGLFFAHANARFLPQANRSMFEGATFGEDRPIDLTRTMLELGPDISEALSRLISRGNLLPAISQLYRLIRQLPAEERASVIGLLNEVLPFRRLWQLSFGRLLPRHPANDDGTDFEEKVS